MDTPHVAALFRDLTTPHIADACVRRGVTVRCAPTEVRPLDPLHCRIAGRVVPARHSGSVDVFLEALETARPGDVLVADNRGRLDEACIGDLVTLEANQARLAGIIIWGLHRDTPEILEIGMPVFSLGAIPTGPLRVDPREPDALTSATVGPWSVSRADLVIADENGVLFVPVARAEEIATAARGIRDTEHVQAAKMKAGTTLRTQLRFPEFLTQRAQSPALTFRQHLRRISGAIEE